MNATTRDEWEAAQYAKMKALPKQHSLVDFHLYYKDGVLVAVRHEIIDRFNGRGSDSKPERRGTVTP